MRVRLMCRKETREEIIGRLSAKEIAISDVGEFILYQRPMREYIVGKAMDGSGDMAIVYFKDICYFESQDHTVMMRSNKDAYQVEKTLGDLEEELPPDIFLRICQSYIVNIKHIRKINQFSADRQFLLQMDDGTRITVTRSYYLRFRNLLGI